MERQQRALDIFTSISPDRPAFPTFPVVIGRASLHLLSGTVLLLSSMVHLVFERIAQKPRSQSPPVALWFDTRLEPRSRSLAPTPRKT